MRRFFQIDGVNALRLSLRVRTERTELGVIGAMQEVGRDLKRRSQAIVPYRTGNLHDHAFYGIGRTLSGPELTVGYSGVPYALVQHERLDFRHAPGRQAKYLEQPFLENAGRYSSHIASEARGALT